MTSALRTITRCTIAVIAVAGLLLGVPVTQAQQGADEATLDEQPPPVWVQNFGKQLRQSLTSDNTFIRQQALHHITYFATFYEEKIDFSDAVPTLVEMYREDDDANVRLHALVALYAIGDEKGMRQVRSSLYAQRWPPRLQLVTLSALVDYYGPETFEMDEEAAAMARNLIKYYTPKPRVEVGPLEVVQPGQ
jgi:hypothetical protein